MLLIPEVVELDAAACARLLDAAADLARLGLVFEPFGGQALCLRETPALLGEVDGARLLADVADALAEDRGAGWRRGSTRCSPAWPATARCGPGGSCAPRR